MSKNPFARIAALLLIVGIVAPSAFFLAPERAHAILGAADTTTIIGDVSPTGISNAIHNVVTATETTFTAVKGAITAVASVTSSIANVALQIDKYVLEPIAFVVSGNLLKAITASVLKFVNGQTNGTGQPQFVQNLRGNLQGVGDNQALAFFAQFAGGSNSPFSAAITSSLRTNYLQQTSVAGFFAANQCTLTQASSNINQFLAGNWSQGGAGAWLALTTNNKNNPYVLHQRAQAELYALVSGASTARSTELGWGQGFLSWCGAKQDSTTNANGTISVSGQTCLNKDGTPGTIQTPGSVIGSTLNKVLGSVQDKLTAIGSVGPEVNTILSNIATVMNTVNFATQLLGGPTGGLAAAGNTSSTGRPSALTQYTDDSGFLGITQTDVNQTASTLPSSGSDMATRVNQYETAWATISTAAQNASTTVTSLATSCTTQASAAQTALQTEIAPVFTQASAAATAIKNARAMILKVQVDLSAGSDTSTSGAGGAYLADTQALQTMAPTATDLAQAQQDAQIFGTAQANPTGSLTVTSASLVDEMNLIATNAQALSAACFAPPVTSTL